MDKEFHKRLEARDAEMESFVKSCRPFHMHGYCFNNPGFVIHGSYTMMMLDCFWRKYNTRCKDAEPVLEIPPEWTERRDKESRAPYNKITKAICMKTKNASLVYVESGRPCEKIN